MTRFDNAKRKKKKKKKKPELQGVPQATVPETTPVRTESGNPVNNKNLPVRHKNQRKGNGPRPQKPTAE